MHYSPCGHTEADRIPEAVKTTLDDMHARSTSPWQARTIRKSIRHLEPLLSSAISSEIVKTTWQSPTPTRPSTEITLALNELVSATRLLGIPRDVETRVIQNMAETFVRQARALEGWTSKTGEASVQAAVDLGFLTLLNGSDVSKDEMVRDCLSNVSLWISQIKLKLVSGASS